MARQADEIWASKGTKLVHLDLKQENYSDNELADVLLGPTGNLRAPTFKVGRVLLVGFNEDAYKHLLSNN